MAVVKMKRLSLFAHKRDADALISRLMRLGCIELKKAEYDEPEEENSGNIIPDSFGDSERCIRIERRIERVKNAISVLSKYSKRKKGLAAKKISVRLDKFKKDGSYDAAMNTVKSSERLTERLSEIKSEKARLDTVKKSLLPWAEHRLPLDFSGTEKTVASCVTLPAAVTGERIASALGDTPAELIKVGGERTASCYLLICLKGYADEARAKLASLGMLPAPFESMKGTAAQELGEIKKKLSALEGEEEDIGKKFEGLAEKLELVEILSDYEATALTAEMAKADFMPTELCILVEGYFPETDEKRVAAALSKFGCAYDISEPKEGEDVPVLLKNNFFASCFEWVMGMYSYPRYGSYDPTFIMSIFYFIIFGLMFADVGYGFIMTVGCFAAIKLLNPGKGMRSFLAMFGYCGISSMIMGVLFGAYFGNMPQAFAENMLGHEGAMANMNTAILFDPLLDPMSFLILSLAVGAVHLIAGMAVQFYILCRKGQWIDALCDIATWWLTFAGIGLTVAFPWGKYVLIAGLASIVLTQGRREKNIFLKIGKGLLGIYGGVNYAADLLSYSRILALGLAASVIGQVINTMGTMPGPSIFGFIAMTLIFIVGHLLNLAINVLGTFVHTSRLQYIEFFGKFFEDGGRPMKPLASSDKYTKDN